MPSSVKVLFKVLFVFLIGCLFSLRRPFILEFHRFAYLRRASSISRTLLFSMVATSHMWLLKYGQSKLACAESVSTYKFRLSKKKIMKNAFNTLGQIKPTININFNYSFLWLLYVANYICGLHCVSISEGCLTKLEKASQSQWPAPFYLTIGCWSCQHIASTLI